MNKNDLWNFLESSSDTEIQIYITISIVYLIKSRNMELKDIIKDIKKAYSDLERGR